jgi:hypothetical protein
VDSPCVDLWPRLCPRPVQECCSANQVAVNRLTAVVRNLVLPLCLLLGAMAVLPLVQQWIPSAAADDEEVEYGRLLVITNFDTTEVEINGVSYPYEWIWGESGGVYLPAGIDLRIVVSVSPEQSRSFRVNLNPDETRVLVVDIENMGAAPVAAAPATGEPIAQAAAEEGSEPAENVGYLGVSSSPRGIVHVDGESTGQRTPARRIALEPGRHEVTVFYDEEEQMSEVKHVLIRQGVNTNVFFRLRREQQTETE